MASLSSLIPATAPPLYCEPAQPVAEDALLLVNLGSGAAADYAEYARRQGNRKIVVVANIESVRTALRREHLSEIVLFLGPRLTERDQAVIEALAVEKRVSFVGIVSTFRVDLGCPIAAEQESFALSRLKPLGARTVVFRPGHVLSDHSRAGLLLRRFGACYPLVPSRLRSCCVDGDELFAAIEAERRAGRNRRFRQFTLLGPNRPWRELLTEHRAANVVQLCLTALSALLSLLLIGQVAALFLSLAIRFRPGLRHWNFDTLQPRSFGELLGLYHPYNYRYVKVVGYNNGVVHFGQSYPGKTVVSTVHCNRVVRVGADSIKVDCGATIRKALDFLASDGQELYVIPNYSYVCLGTAFFVPIHGSAADFTTVAETVTRVLLYDPQTDRFLAAGREGEAFRENLYNLRSDVLLLRLHMRVKKKAPYFVHKETREDPTSAELLTALRDRQAANVEIRKARAANTQVDISRYYQESAAAQGPVLELPRDSLGKLWDKLETNPLTSFLFHGLTRYLAWHVELFFTEKEFGVFWDTHATLPLHKIQLRYIRRDGFPHSPFRDQDCVSADLIMLRRRRGVFETYLKEMLPGVRKNPGKHSA